MKQGCKQVTNVCLQKYRLSFPSSCLGEKKATRELSSNNNNNSRNYFCPFANYAKRDYLRRLFVYEMGWMVKMNVM
jgi:hypothetical protein